MKSYKEIEKKHTAKEIAESIVFPGTKDEKERAAMLSEFQEFRKSQSKKQSGENKTISLLLQLKFLIEDYQITGFLHSVMKK